MFGSRNQVVPAAPPEHVEQVGEQMRDTTELDGLRDEMGRNLKGELVKLPWQTGRPLRSAGMDEATGLPVTPLAALDLAALVPPAAAERLAAELRRAVTLDAAAEGLLDHAEESGEGVVVQETQEEADVRRDKELATNGDVSCPNP